MRTEPTLHHGKALSREKVINFIRQHLLLVVSLFVMTLGVALCVRSKLGSSVISTIPFVLTLAGEDKLIMPLTIGEWTYVMNFVLVGLQLLILRRRFEPVQLFQLVIGFLFGWLLDVNMTLTAALPMDGFIYRLLAQVAGCTILGIGIAFEVRCGSVTMPGEGFPAAICKLTRAQFAKMKIIVDVSLVLIAATLGFLFFHRWVWEVVGFGTLFAMIYVGLVVKVLAPRIRWFDRLLYGHTGGYRFLFGLARWLCRHK